MAEVKDTLPLASQTLAKTGLSPNEQHNLLNETVRFVCPVQDTPSHNILAKDGPVMLFFRNASDFCFFNAVRDRLEAQYGTEGRKLGDVVAAVSLAAPEAAREKPFDRALADLLKNPRFVSVTDFSAQVEMANAYARRWGIEYENIGDTEATTNPDRQAQLIALDSRNASNCDHIWACNVVSYGGIEDLKASGQGPDFWIYQTLASLVSMLKPTTGKLLCVNQYDPRPHPAQRDHAFQEWMGVASKEHPQRQPNLLEFTRMGEKTLTPLDFVRWYDEHRVQIEKFQRF